MNLQLNLNLKCGVQIPTLSVKSVERKKSASPKKRHSSRRSVSFRRSQHEIVLTGLLLDEENLAALYRQALDEKRKLQIVE